MDTEEADFTQNFHDLQNVVEELAPLLPDGECSLLDIASDMAHFEASGRLLQLDEGVVSVLSGPTRDILAWAKRMLDVDGPDAEMGIQSALWYEHLASTGAWRDEQGRAVYNRTWTTKLSDTDKAQLVNLWAHLRAVQDMLIGHATQQLASRLTAVLDSLHCENSNSERLQVALTGFEDALTFFSPPEHPLSVENPAMCSAGSRLTELTNALRRSAAVIQAAVPSASFVSFPLAAPARYGGIADFAAKLRNLRSRVTPTRRRSTPQWTLVDSIGNYDFSGQTIIDDQTRTRYVALFERSVQAEDTGPLVDPLSGDVGGDGSGMNAAALGGYRVSAIGRLLLQEMAATESR